MSEEYAGPAVDLAHLGPREAFEKVIRHAAELKASDLYLASNDDHINVSVRLLGIIQPVARLSAEQGRRCIAHVKAVAGMDVTERRKPLDGRWLHEAAPGKTIDLRVNTLPTLHGEDLAVRLFDRDARPLRLEDLGLLRRDFNQLLGLLNAPSGLILVTGPTGAGKTTTLYACLAYLNNGQRKINTIEDPIEYALTGIRQSQVHAKIGLDFPDLLRGVLRQAPDVVMVGEVRDPVTAETAVRAAASGQLVLATLHAPTASAAVQSLLSLGVHRHFLSSALRGAVAQRLVRTLCPHCRIEFDLSLAPHSFDAVRPWLEPGQGTRMFGPGKCDRCHGQGYIGRTGVFEVLPVTADVRRLIGVAETTAQAIRRKAVSEGMIEFQHAALLKVAQGETAIEEVIRTIPVEELEVTG